jgi:AcrR family transcriptional regulator
MAKKRTLDAGKVLETALALADEHGADNVTLAAVANALDIRIPSLYNHVEGLPGLRYQMALWTTRQFEDRLRRAAVGKSGEAAIMSVAYACRDFALAHPGLYVLTQRPAQADQPELAAAQHEVVAILVAILEPYGYDEDNRLHTVRALRSILHGFVDLEAHGGFGMPLDIEVSFRQLLDLFMLGLNARNAQGAGGDTNT